MEFYFVRSIWCVVSSSLYGSFAYSFSVCMDDGEVLHSYLFTFFGVVGMKLGLILIFIQQFRYSFCAVSFFFFQMFGSCLDIEKREDKSADRKKNRDIDKEGKTV